MVYRLGIAILVLLSLFAVACSKVLNGTFAQSSTAFSRTSDSFNRANSGTQYGVGSANLTDAGLGGTPWPYFGVIEDAVMGITSGTLSITSLSTGAQGGVVFLDPGKTGCDVEAIFSTLSTAAVSFMLIRRDPVTMYNIYVAIEKSGTLMPAGYYLGMTNNLGDSQLGYDATIPVDGVRVRVEQSGSNIVVKINDVPLGPLSVSETSLMLNTQVGVGGAYDDTTQVDSWLVENCD